MEVRILPPQPFRRKVFRNGRRGYGFCIGVQIVFEQSEEENTACLGLVPGRVVRFPDEIGGERLKVPQIGWNQVKYRREHPLFAGVPNGQSFYFVNSYHVVPTDDDVVFAKTTYGIDFPSVVGRKNLVATQFHLEKSGEAGLRMLDNFCHWNGEL